MVKTNFILSGVLLNLGFLSSGFGEATFELRNLDPRYGINAPLFDAQGVPLTGTNYLAELYGGTSPYALKPATDDTQRRIIVAFGTAGYFSYLRTEVFIPATQGLSWVWLQVRAWDARLGLTYEEAAVRGLGGYGESPLFYAQGGIAGHLGPPPPPLIGLQSFRLRPMTPAALVRGFLRQGDQFVIELNPGFKRFQLQQTSELSQSWENVGEPTTATSLTNSITGSAQFFRVIGLLD